jgi:hypothetical protein
MLSSAAFMPPSAITDWDLSDMNGETIIARMPLCAHEMAAVIPDIPLPIMSTFFISFSPIISAIR